MTAPYKLICQCGAVELSVVLAEALADARRCDCSFCRRRAAATVGMDEADLQVVRGEALALYRWNTGTAEHWFCSVCGIYTHHRRRSDPSEFGVNLGALDGVDPRALEPIGWVDGVNHPSDADRNEREGAA